MKVAVSYLKSKYDLKTTIIKINNTNADYLHVDVMDGKFVNNKTCEYEKISDTLKTCTKPIDIHLMVENPKEYILKYKELHPDIITIHYEINNDLENLIDLIHSFGIKAGISIKPNTKVKDITHLLPIVDNVLVMSVEPGMGGQEFIKSTKRKVNKLNEIRYKKYNYMISVDGGINDITVKKVKYADFVISGSYICMNDDYQKRITSIRYPFGKTIITSLVSLILTIINTLFIVHFYYKFATFDCNSDILGCLGAIGYYIKTLFFAFFLLITLITFLISLIRYIYIKNKRNKNSL